MREWTINPIDTPSFLGYATSTKLELYGGKRLKKNIPHILLCIFVLAGCLSLSLLFGRILFVYTIPTEDASYDLSLDWDEQEMLADWHYDQKGWTVFLQEGEQITPLTANGFGGFTGLQKPGQTFYFSRTLTETLDSPVLRLGTANRTIAVFLDGELFYTDCPELDNRIGYLTLPMSEQDREKPVILSLPPHYQGKTLTIAQSTGAGEKQDEMIADTVWPCSVTLYCGYSYESSMISESFRTAIPAALCFGTGVLLLAVFLWQFFSHKTDWNLPLLALASFLWCTRQITLTGFTHIYFYFTTVNVPGLSRLLSLTVLLLFLTNRLTGRLRFFFGILSTLHGATVLLGAFPNINMRFHFLWQSIPEWIGLLGLLGFLAYMWREWKQKNPFFRFFCPFIVTGLAVFLAWILAVPTYRQYMVQQFF